MAELLPKPADPTLADIVDIFQKRIAALEATLATRSQAILLFSNMNIEQRKRIDQLEAELRRVTFEIRQTT